MTEKDCTKAVISLARLVRSDTVTSVMAFKSTCQTLQKVSDDEPIFVIRAQDYSAADTILYWLTLNPQLTASRRLEALACVKSMLAWTKQKAAD